MKSAPQQSVTALSAGKRVLLFVVLVAAGLAGNYLHYEFFFGIQFIFGSIFAMLALLFLGIGPGMLAGAIISSYTYILLNHPYTIVVMTAEVLAVGLLVRRRRTGFVLADALYWLFIGMPLVFLFYHNVMHLPLHNAVVSMLKQGTNGIANALIARLLFTAGAARWKFELISMREALFNILALFCLLPSLFLIARASHDELAEIEQSVRDGLLLSGQRTEKMVNTWLDQRIKTVEHLAWMAANTPVPIMQKHIEHMQGNDQGFLRMGLLNRDATIVAYSPLVDELGQSNIGRNFKDRPFIPVLRKTLQPMLSEVVMGRIGVPKPMATALAPVVVKGHYAGYMTGILNLEQIDALIGDISKASALPGREYVLLDKNSRVILGSRKDRKVMEVYSREPGDDVKLDQNIRLWIPAGARNVAVSDRWKKARYHMEIPLGGISGWRLVLEQPLAPFQKLLYERYTAQFAWMLGIVLAALVIADFMSRRTTAPLGALGGLSSGLPEKLMKRETIRWPESAIQETSALIGNVRTMSRTLDEQFGAVQRMNVELERRVDERTRELRESEERFRSLIENTSDWIWEIDEKARYTYASPRVRDILGYEPHEVIGSRPFDFMSPE
ncbi:MAG TPA: PAS domain S-box protein, partial [Nitrospirota bacterium]